MPWQVCRFAIARCAVLVTILLGLAPNAQANPEEQAIRHVFASYRTAVLSGDGEVGAKLLSQTTIEYYDQMRHLALYGSGETVRNLSLINQMQVLLFRARMDPMHLKSMSGHDVLAYAIKQGWTGKSSIVQLQIGKVLIEDPVAVAHGVFNGQDAGPAFRFVKEAGAWRFDLLPMLQASNAALQMSAMQQGISERDFMLILIESVVGRKLGPEMWEPPLKAP